MLQDPLQGEELGGDKESSLPSPATVYTLDNTLENSFSNIRREHLL